MRITCTPVTRRLYPRHGIVVQDGVGRRSFWYANRQLRDAQMIVYATEARRQAGEP